jgi:hypothetical protein
MIDQLYNEYAELFPLIGNQFHPHYKQCSISVMDNIADPNIRFDKTGACHYYHFYNRVSRKCIIRGEAGRLRWQETISHIKANKGNGKYDCLIGLSGGIDSAYICLLAKEAGLNPLLIHLDNTWDSETSVRNIENILEQLQFDYETLVIDNKTFEILQKAYIKSSVVDLDIITDHAILVSLYRTAIKHGIQHVITGYNIASEITLPTDWCFDWRDQKNILAIIKHSYPDFTNDGTYPTESFANIKKLSKRANLTFYDPINWHDYDVKKTQAEIEQKLHWKALSGKHHESIWTRFFQCYILPVKYNIDKRKAHLSNLIYSGQMTKAEAMETLRKPPYSRDVFKKDLTLLLTRFEWSLDEFNETMKLPVKKHTDYAYEYTFRNQLKPLYAIGRALKNMIEDARWK